MARISFTDDELSLIVERAKRAVLAEMPKTSPAPSVSLSDVRAEWGAADRKFGHELGCDGMIGLGEVKQLLGGVGRVTVWRLWKRGAIRKAKVCGRTTYCRRSILNYLKSNEC